jgi:anti-anti-sigma regulatory factor/DNA-directed RNA polymerase subunit RPC12/RpoP
MIKVAKEVNGNVLTLRLSGSIEETVNLDEMVGPTPGEVRVDCKEITRINSVGVKGWIKYFQTLQNKSTKLTFFQCSTAIVEQINLISNFTCGGSVESIYVPFACTNCKAELIALFRTADLNPSSIQLPELKCTKCTNKAVFDDIEEEYFAFLSR